MERLQGQGAIEEATSEEEENHFILLSGTFKVFVTYIQLLFMLQWIQKQNPVLPSSFVAIMGIAQALFSTSYTFISLECALGHFYDVNKQIRVSIYNVGYPFVVFTAIVLYYSARHLSEHMWGLWRKRNTAPIDAKDPSILLEAEDEDNNTRFRTKLISAANISVFYFYQNWAQAILLMFLCYTVNDPTDDTELAIKAGLNPGPRWFQTFDLICFEGQHATLTYVLGIPGLVFIVLYPMLSAWYLAAQCHLLGDGNFRSRYGFMYDEYKPRFFAWESWIMFRKLAMAAVLMFLSSETYPAGSQVLATLLIVIAGLIVHIIFRPYSSDYVHNLELMSQLTITATLYLSLYFVAPIDVPSGYQVISIVLSALNIIVPLIFLCSMVTQTLDGMLLMAGLKPEDIDMLSREQVSRLMAPRFPGVFGFMATPAAALTIWLHRVRAKLRAFFSRIGAALRGQGATFVRTVVKRNNTISTTGSSEVQLQMNPIP